MIWHLKVFDISYPNKVSNTFIPILPKERRYRTSVNGKSFQMALTLGNHAWMCHSYFLLAVIILVNMKTCFVNKALKRVSNELWFWIFQFVRISFLITKQNQKETYIVWIASFVIIRRNTLYVIIIANHLSWH